MGPVIADICNVWWSPKSGSQYTFTDRGEPIGIGTVAWKNPGAFNLFWLLANLSSGTDLASRFYRYARLYSPLLALVRQDVDGYPIQEWAVILRPQEFASWSAERFHTIPQFTPLGMTAYGSVATKEQFNRAIQNAVS